MKRLLIAAVLLALPVKAICAETFHVGAPVSDFTVQEMNGHSLKVRAHGGHATVVMFFSTRCPISNAFNYRRNTIYNDFKGSVKFIAVDSNANESLEEVRQYAHDVGFDFPVYRDVGNQVADRFGVLATTDSFVIDSFGVMQYRGYVEDSPNPSRATKQALRLAIEEVLAGKPVAVAQTKAIGCAIRRTRPQETAQGGHPQH